MSAVTEESFMRSLLAELFAGSIYKGRQGRIVRQVTCLALWLTIGLGGWQLYEALNSGVFESLKPYRITIPAVLSAIGFWCAFRLVNWPKFADFLISVEAEMTKVSWPTKNELYRASLVVIFTMAFMALMLFCYDLVWQLIFDTLRVS